MTDKNQDIVNPESYKNRMRRAEEMRIVGTFSNKLSRDSLAEIIGQFVHQQTLADWSYGEFEETPASLTIIDYAADAVQPEELIRKMEVERWNAVHSVDFEGENIQIKFW